MLHRMPIPLTKPYTSVSIGGWSTIGIWLQISFGGQPHNGEYLHVPTTINITLNNPLL